MESAYCMNTGLAAMLSMMEVIEAKAWLSALARGPCSMAHKAVMISAFSTPSQGNLRTQVVGAVNKHSYFIDSRIYVDLEPRGKGASPWGPQRSAASFVYLR